MSGAGRSKAEGISVISSHITDPRPFFDALSRRWPKLPLEDAVALTADLALLSREYLMRLVAGEAVLPLDREELHSLEYALRERLDVAAAGQMRLPFPGAAPAPKTRRGRLQKDPASPDEVAKLAGQVRAAGISMRELAATAKVDPANLSRMLAGRLPLPVPLVERLREALRGVVKNHGYLDSPSNLSAAPGGQETFGGAFPAEG